MVIMSKRTGYVLVLLALVGACSAGSASTQPDAVVGGVVRVTARCGHDASRGSGFIVCTTADTAYVATVTHVTWPGTRDEGTASDGEAPIIEVEFRSLRDRPIRAVVRHREPDENGLALLAVAISRELASTISPLPLAPTYDVRPLEEVWVIGDSARSGPWSVVARRAKSVLGRDLVLDGTTEAGYSGGPVLKDQRVVGMVARGDAADTIAIPAASIWTFARNLVPSGALEGASLESEPEFARARRKLVEWGVECTDTRFLESVAGGQADVVRLFLIANPGYAHLRFDPRLLERAPQPTAEDAARAAAEAAEDAKRGLRTVEPTKWSPLMVAVLYDQGGVISELLRAGADVDEPTDVGRPLSIAAMAGNARAVKALIAGGAGTETDDVVGASALELTAQCGDYPEVELWAAGLDFANVPHRRYVEVAQELLRAGPSVTSDKVRSEALVEAAGRGDAEMTGVLLNGGAKPDAGGNTLAAAVMSGNTDVVHAILARVGGPSKLGEMASATITRGQENRTLLYWAAKARSEKMARLLIEAGAEPDAAALGAAVAGRSAAIVGMLLDNGADANATSIQGRRSQTMLQIAAANGDVETARLLLSRGAVVNASLRDRYPQSNDAPPLELAVVRGDAPMVQLLLEHGARPDATTTDLVPDDARLRARLNYSRMHLLHIAAMKQDQTTVQLLLSHGADVDARCTRNPTYTQYVMAEVEKNTGEFRAKYREVQDHAIAAGAGVSGWTPLYIAIELDDLVITKLLIQSGAKVNARTEGGWTPLDWAEALGKEEIAVFLRSRGAAHGSRRGLGSGRG